MAYRLRRKRRDNRSSSAFARLRPGIGLKQAQTQISATNARLGQAYPDTNKGWDVRLVALHDLLVREVKPSLLVLFGAVAFVLLIACANVANLLLARAASRQKEIAIRAAMGASRGRIIRQMMTESLLLSIIGGMRWRFAQRLVNRHLVVCDANRRAASRSG